MENHGLLPDIRPFEEKLDDCILGTESQLEVIARTTDWDKYLSAGIPQSVPGKWDSMSCVSFAIDQQFEPQMNFDYESFSSELKNWLNENGYMVNGKVVLSKRFLAIASETKPTGNYFAKVYNTARNIGLIPEKDLPFGGNSTEEYLSATLTKAMYDKASEFKKRFEITYQLANGYDQKGGFTKLEISASKEALKTAPLVVGVPIPCGHAILMHDIREHDYDALDHYVPYRRTNDANKVPVYIAYMGYIRPRPTVAPVKPKMALTRNLGKGSRGSDVVALQDLLKAENCFPKYIASTGLFAQKTAEAVTKFQEKYADEILKSVGLTRGTGYVGTSTRAFINNKYK